MHVVLLAGMLMLNAAPKLNGGAPANQPQYSERDVCVMWAAAQCHASSCDGDKGKERCAAESRKCNNASKAKVGAEKGQKIAACAKAMLKAKCGAPAPGECADVSL